MGGGARRSCAGAGGLTSLVAAAIAKLIDLRFSRGDEMQADQLGVRLMSKAGYDPRAMIGVMEVLEAVSRGRGRPPEFFATHPNPEHRVDRIRQAIQELYLQGVPPDLAK